MRKDAVSVRKEEGIDLFRLISDEVFLFRRMHCAHKFQRRSTMTSSTLESRLSFRNLSVVLVVELSKASDMTCRTVTNFHSTHDSKNGEEEIEEVEVEGQ